MAGDQLKRFDRWRQKLPENTSYLTPSSSTRSCRYSENVASTVFPTTLVEVRSPSVRTVSRYSVVVAGNGRQWKLCLTSAVGLLLASTSRCSRKFAAAKPKMAQR